MANMAEPIEITREPFKPGQAKPGTTVEEAAPTVILDETAGADAGSAEDMLADAKKAAEEKDRQLEHERQRTRDAEERARRATEEAGKQAVGRIAEQQRSAKAELDAATSAKRAAMDALRAARDAGDLDAEAKAIDDLTDANVRAREAQGQVARIDAAIKQGDRQGGDRRPHQGADGGESPEFRAWKQAHPKFETDPIYRGVAIGAHERALQDGIIEGSPAYWRAVNQTITEHFGDEQGGSGGGRGKDMGDQRGNADDGQNGATRERPAAFSGAPPARSGDGNSPQGYRTVRTITGDSLHVRMGQSGAMQIKFPNPQTAEKYREAAEWNGMTLAAYAQEQVLAAQERASGGNGGLIEGNEMQIR